MSVSGNAATSPGVNTVNDCVCCSELTTKRDYVFVDAKIADKDIPVKTALSEFLSVLLSTTVENITC